MKINIFRVDFSNISAKTEALAVGTSVSCQALSVADLGKDFIEYEIIAYYNKMFSSMLPMSGRMRCVGRIP